MRPGEQPRDAARRETMEEHGVKTGELAYITTISDNARDVVLYAAFQWVLSPRIKEEKNPYMTWVHVEKMHVLQPCLKSVVPSQLALLRWFDEPTLTANAGTEPGAPPDGSPTEKAAPAVPSSRTQERRVRRSTRGVARDYVPRRFRCDICGDVTACARDTPCGLTMCEPCRDS